MSSSRSDDDLMAAIAAGDQNAFTELLRRHRTRILRLVQAFVHDVDQAEDLTQEVFCRVSQSAGRYRSQGNFVAWIKRVAVNLAKSDLRQRNRAVLIPLHEAEESLPGEPDPLDVLMAEGLKGEVREAIQSLPEEQRMVLVMRFFGDMSLEDIAWALRCPEGTVKSRLFNGLRRVRQALDATWRQ